MSIVERAIKKLQEASPHGKAPMDAAASVREPALGGIVSAPPPAAAARVTPAPKPTKHVEISSEALRAAALLPPKHQERQIADEYRQIKRPLIDNILGTHGEKLPKGQIIMMASALPGEGKTFTSINLAFSLAMERDLHVLLVDADILKPHITRMFGLSDEPGLVDALADPDCVLDELILATNVPGLSVLPVGRATETTTELLASRRMVDMIAQFAARDPQRIILFDSPPLLLTTEARALANVVGQIVVVVRADHTPRNALLEALDLLGDGKPIGLVLNQCASSSAAGYYGYGQRYGEAQQPSA